MHQQLLHSGSDDTGTAVLALLLHSSSDDTGIAVLAQLGSK